MTLKSDAKFKKTDLWFQIWHEEFREFLHNHSKVWKYLFDGIFLSKLYKVWAKKKPGLVVLKMAWEIGEILLEHSKVWKIALWWVLFVQCI